MAHTDTRLTQTNGIKCKNVLCKGYENISKIFRIFCNQSFDSTSISESKCYDNDSFQDINRFNLYHSIRSKSNLFIHFISNQLESCSKREKSRK